MDWLKQVDGTNVLNMVKSVSNKVKQYALNLSEIEIKVEEATNNEPWGPHGTVMQGKEPQTQTQRPFNYFAAKFYLLTPYSETVR
jgi:epsin